MAKSQLWLGTHSIGILRAAKKIMEENPGEVVFLDFTPHNFDEKVEMEPITQPNRSFWNMIVFLKISLACWRQKKLLSADSMLAVIMKFLPKIPDALFVSQGGIG